MKFIYLPLLLRVCVAVEKRGVGGGTTCLDELTSFERQIGKFPHSAGTSLSPPGRCIKCQVQPSKVSSLFLG